MSQHPSDKSSTDRSGNSGSLPRRSSDQPNLAPGTRIGNYVLTEYLKRGGFAEVWKARHHERPEKIAAIKIPTSQEHRKQLAREGRIPDISHPNIVPIWDSDTRFADVPYIVMPFYQSGSLRNLLDSHRNGIDESRVEVLLHGILSGVKAAHDRDVIHRDVKPENILIDAKGDPALSDFGLSVLPPQTDVSIMQSESISGEGSAGLAGSLPYLAPEVREGESASKASDVFSLGVVLFEMLTGRRPSPVETPSEVRPSLRHAAKWDALYRNASTSIGKRFTDANAMLEQLISITNSNSISSQSSKKRDEVKSPVNASNHGGSQPGHANSGHADHAHSHDLPFWRKYIFSVDHKVIGVQYTVTALCFLFFGFCLMAIMRWQMAYPNQPVPIVGSLFGNTTVGKSVFSANEDGNYVLNGDGYNAFGAMHGTIMVFLAIVPLGVGGFGNFVLPLQIGAPDMAFPKLNMASYWVYLPGGIIMLASFFITGGAAASGWTSYAPLSTIATTGQTAWLIGMIFLITSSLLGSVNFIVTTVQMRAKGLSFFRLPFFVWAQLVTSFLLLLAFPPLEAAGVLQLMDRVAGTSFFDPGGLIVSGVARNTAGGGSPLLWQHLFWFLAHPEVYVLILPAMGIVAEVIANNTRKPLWGYKSLVYSAIFLGFMSFIVWAHHMFMTGMGTTLSTFFQFTTMVISIPSVIILTCLIISLYGASIRYTVPMLFALSFLPMFAIGGLTGLPLGLTASDIHLHDTYYVIGHFHYVVAPGTIFAMFAGIYFWFPKVTGRMMNKGLGVIHWALSFAFINGVFMPMLFLGMAGVLRRQFDQSYQMQGAATMGLTRMVSWSAWCLLASQLPFIINFFWSIFAGRRVERNPWQATTLEWAAPSPPPHGNFEVVPVVYCGPYEYSVPGKPEDYCPQSVNFA